MATQEPHEIILDLDSDKELAERLGRMGGETLVRLVVFSRDNPAGELRRVVATVRARVSGDDRAGSQSGVHLTLSVHKRHADTDRHAHALPWLKVCPVCSEVPTESGKCETRGCAYQGTKP